MLLPKQPNVSAPCRAYVGPMLAPLGQHGANVGPTWGRHIWLLGHRLQKQREGDGGALGNAYN